MSSIVKPHIYAFKADAAISKGHSVKIGTDSKHVAKATAASDKQVGVAQNDVTTAEDIVEVAVGGGGAQFLAGGSISAGDMLTATSSGAVVATTSNADRCIGYALEDAVSGDVFSGVVVVGII